MESDKQNFFERVYEIVYQIPRGRVTTYGAIAAFLGSKGSSRLVGWAMNQSHNACPGIPAHRVVNRLGILTGKHHFGSPSMMQQLLENENIRIENDRVVDFRKKFWDPARTL